MRAATQTSKRHIVTGYMQERGQGKPSTCNRKIDAADAGRSCFAFSRLASHNRVLPKPEGKARFAGKTTSLSVIRILRRRLQLIPWLSAALPDFKSEDPAVSLFGQRPRRHLSLMRKRPNISGLYEAAGVCSSEKLRAAPSACSRSPAVVSYKSAWSHAQLVRV